LTLTTPLAAENVEGYLVDKMCSAKILKGGADAAKAHSKDCALAPNCKASGFGVLTSEGKFLKFDADGDRMAEKMIGFASGKDNLKATVNGKVDGDSMTVVAIQLL
jgi:hypothetical protein